MGLRFAPFVTDVDGMLPLSVGTGAPITAFSSQGLLSDPGGAVYATTVDPIARWHAGLPFDANGRLCVEAGAVARVDQGVPFTAAGRVAFTGGTPAVARVNQGVSFTATGTIATK